MVPPSDRRDTMNAWNPRVCQTNPQVPVDCASLHQRDGHLRRAGVASRQHLHAFLLPEIARKPLTVGNAMPRFDANKVRSRFRPNAKVGCIRKAHLDARSVVASINDGAAFDFIEYEDIVAKQSIRKCQTPMRDRRRMARKGKQPSGVDAPDGGILFAFEFDEMRCPWLPEWERPTESRVVAEAK